MLEENLKSTIESEFTTPDQPIYHYTSDQNYSEICRAGYLRLNSHIFLNEKDPTNQELQVAARLIMDRLNKHKELKNQIDTFEQFISKKIVYYTLSLCLRKSIICSSKYGNCCIEFNPDLFKQFQKKSSSTIFGNVIYDSTKQEAIISTMFDLYDKSTKDARARENLFLYLTIIIPLFKSNEHINDNECRVIQAEIYSPESGQLSTPLVTKKVPFLLREISKVHREV